MIGSSLAASSQSMIRCAVVANRSTILRAALGFAWTAAEADWL
jgi:hypothetical protein